MRECEEVTKEEMQRFICVLEMEKQNLKPGEIFEMY